MGVKASKAAAQAPKGAKTLERGEGMDAIKDAVRGLRSVSVRSVEFEVVRPSAEA